MVLLTLWPLALKTRLMLAPASLSTLTAPLAALALAALRLAALAVNTGAVGASVSRMKLVLPSALVLPARSVALALTLTAPWPSTIKSTLVSTTGCAAPLPVRVLLTLWPLAAKVTSTLAPDSAATVMAPALFRALSAPSVAAAATSTGAFGVRVSRTKLVLTLALSCPAECAVALTLTVPWPRVARSAALSATAVALPLLLMLLLTLWPLAVKTTLTMAPASALRVTAPVAARAAFSMDAPAANTGGVTALFSTKLVLPASLMLPAGSVAVALTVMVPWPSVTRSLAVS